MGKRKVFLLFLVSMSFSIMVMIIIYGIFLKDWDPTLHVKNPESAPSPNDIFEVQQSEPLQAKSQSPAKVSIPDEAPKKLKEQEEQPLPERLPEHEPITQMVPLEPHIPQTTDREEGMPELEPRELSSPETTVSEMTTYEPSSGLHYVYMDGFSTRQAAEQAMQSLQQKNLVAYPYIRQHKGKIILQFGVFSDKNNAEIMAQQLRNQSVIVKVD